MEKKTYETPSLTLIALKPATILTGSDDPTTVSFGNWSGSNTPQTDANGNYVIE